MSDITAETETEQTLVMPSREERRRRQVLTEQDKHMAFVRATRGFSAAVERWHTRAETGLNDEELAHALAYELGIEGGSSSTDRVPAYHVRGSGLQIWASWSSPNPYSDEPIYRGASTIAKAREVYGIHDPSEPQLALF